MNRWRTQAGLWALALAALVLTTGCPLPGSNTSSGSTSNPYDGTYDWVGPMVNGIQAHCSSCVFIKNGQISNSEGSFYGQMSDNPIFYGPCPNGNPVTGVYSGMLGGANPYQWQGTWTCVDGSVGGPSSVWKIYNQH